MGHGRIWVCGRGDEVPPHVYPHHRIVIGSRSSHPWGRVLDPRHLPSPAGGTSLAAWWTACAIYPPRRPGPPTLGVYPYGFQTQPVAFQVPGVLHPPVWDPVEARWQLLGPSYEAAVLRCPAARAALCALRAVLDRGHDVVLYDSDAYCPQYTGQSWQQVLNNVRAAPPLSPALFAGMVLDGVTPWNSYDRASVPVPWSTPHPYPLTRARWPRGAPTKSLNVLPCHS